MIWTAWQALYLADLKLETVPLSACARKAERAASSVDWLQRSCAMSSFEFSPSSAACANSTALLIVLVTTGGIVVRMVPSDNGFPSLAMSYADRKREESGKSM